MGHFGQMLTTGMNFTIVECLLVFSSIGLCFLCHISLCTSEAMKVFSYASQMFYCLAFQMYVCNPCDTDVCVCVHACARVYVGGGQGASLH